MKKIKKICLLTLTSTMLFACGEQTDSSESGTEPSSSVASASSEEQQSSQTSTSDSSSLWDAELQKLMKEYCGEVLPYPTGLIQDNISYSIAKGTNGEEVLQITDESNSFTLGDYYETLESKGWYAVRGFNDKAERRSNSLPFYELTKDGADKGYDISYTFRNAEVDEKTGVETKAGNVILCYNNLKTKLTANTEWTDDDLERMKLAITTTLPFFSMGEGYVSHQSSEDVVLLYDYSTIDLRETALAVLEDDGYVLEPSLSKVYNMHILRKFLENGSFISVGLSYQNGNYFQFAYSAVPNVSESWPSEILEEIEQTSGITIPVFTSSDIEKYYYYEKNGKVYIYAETQTNFEYDTDYYSQIEKTGLHGDGWGNFATWDETVSLKAYYIYNYEGQLAVQYAFCILVQLTEPTSNFTKGWPSAGISSYLEEKNINVTCPIPTSIPTNEEVKYSVTSEKGSEALKIQIWDKDLSSYKYLASYFYNQAYYDGINSDRELYFEDPTGKLRLTLSRENNITEVFITKGEGNAHTPVFEFENKELIIGRGSSEQLKLNVSMLPYEVTFSSDNENVTVDENGLVTVSSEAEIGTKATITATIKAPNEAEARTSKCEITIAARTPYTALTAMDELVKSFNAYLGYKEGDEDALKTCYNSDSNYYFVLYNFVGKQWTLTKVQEIVNTYLLLDEYTIYENWTKSTSEYGYPVYTCKYQGDGLIIEYSITLNDGIILFQMKSYQAK